MMFGLVSADSFSEMRLLGTLLFFALAAWAQAPRQPATVWVKTTTHGDLQATLTVPAAGVSDELRAALSRAIGCDNPDRGPSDEYRIEAKCSASHPSRLTFHSGIRLNELAPLLRRAGVGHVQLILTTARFGFLRLAPDLAVHREASHYYRAEWALDQLPREITLDGGFDAGQLYRLLAWAVGLVLSPFLLVLLRPSTPLRLGVQIEGIFVLGWTCWIWVLMRESGGPLIGFVLGDWGIGMLPVLLLPPLLAVWIGSRVAAARSVRLTPDGLGAEYYRRVRFWTGAAATCFLTTGLHLVVRTADNATGFLLVGFGLTVACLLCLRRGSRGGSRPLAQGDLRQRVFAFAAKAGVRLRGVTILTSKTPRPPLAFAARWGVVLLNEALLGRLSRREVDAIVCHELSHLRPANRSSRTMMYLLVVLAIVGSMWIPNFGDFLPLFLLAAYFSFKAWRRNGEYKADADSVLWCGDAEAMITGLARVCHAHNMPLEWGAPISWMLTHPSTMDRLRAIARTARLDEARLAQLIEESRRDATDHYVEVEAARIPEDAAFSPALRKRLDTSLSLFSLAAPGLVGWPVLWLLERFRLPGWMILSGAILLSMPAIYFCFEWICGSIRAKVKQRAVARFGSGVFAGFSPAAEPRLFDGSYHYDLGLVRFVNGMLEFAGDRARFALDPVAVRRIWIGAGPRHWTPRRVVYIECRPSPDAGLTTFSFQSLEAWFWPMTVLRAKRLYQDIDAWHKAASSSPAAPQPCTLPQVEGVAPPALSFRAAIRWIGIYWVAGMVVASLQMTFAASTSLFDLSRIFWPAVVCAALAFFVAAPRLRWSRMEALPRSPSRVPADS
jgi:Zn-dependent protease with chaperone function